MTDELAEAPKETTFKSKALSAGKLLLRSTFTIILRTLGWGALGLMMGVIAFTTFYFAGFFDYLKSFSPEKAHPYWHYAMWSQVVLYPVAGAWTLGYAGMWRGIGRALQNAGLCESGYIPALITRLMSTFSELLRKSETAGAAADKGEAMLANIPLDRLGDALKASARACVLTEESEEAAGLGRRIRRAMKRFLYRRIERYTLEIIRARRAADNSGGGISVEKLKQLVTQVAEAKINQAIENMIRTKLILMSALFAVLIFVLPYVVLLIPAIVASFRGAPH